MELVLNNNGQTITTSLIVAEIFGKEHNKVCRDIENLSCSESFRVANFGETPYIHPQNGQTYRMYEMTKDGFSFLVMGYTGEKAGKFKEDFITAFNKMEQIVKSQIPQSFSEALKLAYEQSLKIEEQQKQLEAQAPKVLFTEAVMGSSSSCLIGELAKIITQNGYEIGEKRLFKYMRENRYLGQKGERYNIPNQQYIEQGLFELKKGTRSGNNGVMHTTITPKVTGKGQVYFVNKFLATAI
jgi:phage regulatory protein, rha family|nr:MAG TPA: KilAC domain protein [Caudoviricetes sp.]